MMLVGYFVLVPQYLQYRINNMEGEATPIVNNINVGKFTDESLKVSINAELAALTFFPVKAGISDMNIKIFENDRKEILNLDIPSQDFWVNQPLKLDLTASINFNKDNQQNTREFMETFSKSGFKDLTIFARFEAPITLFGVLIYKGIPLYKKIDVGTIEPNFKSLRTLMPKNLASTLKMTGKLI